jgi:hypothetical protein
MLSMFQEESVVILDTGKNCNSTVVTAPTLLGTLKLNLPDELKPTAICAYQNQVSENPDSNSQF